MSNTKFNVGDMVRLIRTDDMLIPRDYWVQFDNDWWYVKDDDIELVRPGVFIVVDETDSVTAEHRSLKDAEDDARESAAELKEVFTVYHRIVSFGVKTEIVETRG